MADMVPTLTAFFENVKSVLEADVLPVHSHIVRNLKGSSKVFISVDEEKDGVIFDLIKSSIVFDGRLREGAFGAVFNFSSKGFTNFTEGKSMSQCAFEGSLHTSGSSETLFLASLYLDEIAKEVRGLGDSQSLH